MISTMQVRRIKPTILSIALFFFSVITPILSNAQFSSPFKIAYAAKTAGNQPFVEIQISKVAELDEFSFAYTFSDYATGTPLVSDSTLLPNNNSKVFDDVLIHKMVSPDANKKIALTFKINYKGTSLLQQSILLPTASEKYGFILKNLSDSERLSYVKAGDQIILESKEDKSVYIYKINQDFWASAPPMINATLANSPSVNIDTVVQVKTNQAFTLRDPALYFAQTDTTSRVGMGIKVTPEDYPKFRKIDRVIEPMLYISTQSETKMLRGVTEPKEDLDKFWLTLGGSPENARKVIKRYFQRVSYANHVFTGYKLGWKTDRGIVYIVFGQPDRIVTTTGQQQWIYLSAGGESTVQFDFRLKKNQFSEYHYELVRDSKYKTPWNNTIALWRNGLVR